MEKTYNAASDHYDQPPLSFWDRFGQRTVDRLPLLPGMTVLDVCCGHWRVESRQRVRAASIAGVREADIRQIRADVVYATARRPMVE